MHTVAPDITNTLVDSPEICIAKSIPHEEHCTANSKQFGCKQSLLQNLSIFPLGDALLSDLKHSGIIGYLGVA